MKFTNVILIILFITSCTHTNDLIRVIASVETDSVESTGDAADDPAVWVHPNDVEKSLVFGTNKKHGIYSYNLQGNVKQFLAIGKINNIDIRQNVSISGVESDILAGTNRISNKVEILEIKEGVMMPANIVVPVSKLSEVYGFCMGNIQNQDIVLLATGLDGNAELYELQSDANSANLKLKVTLPIDSKSEGCVIDDTSGDIFIAEEEVGIWRFNYFNLDEKEKVVSVDNKHIYADIEGLALFDINDKKYLIASSQGNSSYPVFNRKDYSFLKTVKVIDDEHIDGTSKTDGIEFSTKLRSKNFPQGVFVVQDDKNTKPRMNQNFKFISAEKIINNL